MATLSRKTQKVFAVNANADQIAVMGTMKTGTPVYSTDIQTLQSAEYQLGWSSAILNDKAPYLEETNGVEYGFSYQLAYILQEGIAEYDAATAYSLKSIVKEIVNGELRLYHPIQLDANGECKGHALSDSAWWARLYIVDYGRIGEPQLTLSNTLPSGCIWLNGSAVSRTTYASLFAIYGTTYGSGNGSTTFNLPNFTNRVIWGSTSFGYISAGLPNITATTKSAGAHTHTKGSMRIYGRITGTDNNEPLTFCDSFNQQGALTLGDAITGLGGITTTSGAGFNTISFDSNRSNDAWTGSTSSNGSHTHTITVAASVSGILNNSSTVQPPAIKVRVYTRYE